MSETKHTPGPWNLEHEVAYGRDIRDSKDRWVATAQGGHDGNKYFPPNDECLPNARLIAAAPTMREALSKVAPWAYLLPTEVQDAIKRATEDADGNA